MNSGFGIGWRQVAACLAMMAAAAMGTSGYSVIAVPLGTVAAYKQGSWLDRGVMGLSVAGFSVPVFLVGYVLIYVCWSPWVRR